MKKTIIRLFILMIFTSFSMLTVGAYSKYTEYDNEKLTQLANSALLYFSPKVEETLPEEYREDILKQVSLLYPNTDINDIKIQYYGKLSNGTLLINHYDSTQSEDILKTKPKTQYVRSSDSNLMFAYCFDSVDGIIDLYQNHRLCSISEAANTSIFTDELLFELAKSVKSYLILATPWDDYLTDGTPGDVNGDTYVSISDATLVQKIVSGLFEPSSLRYQAADINKDGRVDITDATEIQMICAEINAANYA